MTFSHKLCRCASYPPTHHPQEQMEYDIKERHREELAAAEETAMTQNVEDASTLEAGAGASARREGGDSSSSSPDGEVSKVADGVGAISVDEKEKEKRDQKRAKAQRKREKQREKVRDIVSRWPSSQHGIVESSSAEKSMRFLRPP